MKKLIVALSIICIAMVGCGRAKKGDIPAMIMVGGTIYCSTNNAITIEVEESLIRYTSSYAKNGIPRKDGEANFNRDLGTHYAVIDDGRVVVLINDEWIEFKPE